MTKFDKVTTAWFDAFSRYPVDPASISEAARKSAQTGEAIAMTAIKAVEKCNEQTGKWTLESLGLAKEVFEANKNFDEFTKTAKELTSASVESAVQHLTAYTEIAKQAHAESTDILFGNAK